MYLAHLSYDGNDAVYGPFEAEEDAYALLERFRPALDALERIEAWGDVLWISPPSELEQHLRDACDAAEVPFVMEEESK